MYPVTQLLSQAQKHILYACSMHVGGSEHTNTYLKTNCSGTSMSTCSPIVLSTHLQLLFSQTSQYPFFFLLEFRELNQAYTVYVSY